MDVFWKQIREIENNKKEAFEADNCTLCGLSTRGQDKKRNGVTWLGLVHRECAEAVEA